VLCVGGSVASEAAPLESLPNRSRRCHERGHGVEELSMPTQELSMLTQEVKNRRM
jgi:hypothetical protein